MDGRKIGLMSCLADEKQPVTDWSRQDCARACMARQRMAVGAAY